MTTLEQDGPGASVVRDHAFVPRGAWYEVCGHEILVDGRAVVGGCGLAEAAHQTTTLTEEER